MTPRSAIFTVLISLTAASPALADFDQTNQSFQCEAHTTHFAVNRVNEKVFVPYESIMAQSFGSEAIANLMETGEEELSISEAILRLNYRSKSCVLDKSSSTLVRCEVKGEGEHGLFGSDIQFTHRQTSPGGAFQTVTVSRNLNLISARLVVNVVEKKDFRGQPTNRAVAELEVKAIVAGEERTHRSTRDLGEWTDKVDRSNWDRCVMKL